jgi:ArsR family metal-binding transcriptional regulator
MDTLKKERYFYNGKNYVNDKNEILTVKQQQEIELRIYNKFKEDVKNMNLNNQAHILLGKIAREMEEHIRDSGVGPSFRIGKTKDYAGHIRFVARYMYWLTLNG